MKERDRCIIFLEHNGWRCDIYNTIDDYTSYYRKEYFSIDINDEEIVFLSDFGDIYHCNINYYTLIGFLMEFRQLSCNYTSIK